jgi:hypothetical protein
MARFVILEHDHPALHWDLMLQSGAVLRTWRLAAPPAAGQAIDAETSFDHRTVYLDYEGPISGGRGCVVRWDGGTFDWLEVAEERIAVRLQGGRLRGSLRLQRHAEGWRGEFVAEGEDPNAALTPGEGP